MNLYQKKVIERILKDFDSLSKEEIKRTLVSMLKTEFLSFKQLWNSKSGKIWRKYLNPKQFLFCFLITSLIFRSTQIKP